MLSTPHSRDFGRTGFTLIELLIVMGLLATVIAVGAPQLARFFHGRSLDSESRRLLSLIKYAQSRAASESLPMLVWVDMDERRYGLESETSFDEEDLNAAEFTLDRDLEIEVIEDAWMPWDNLEPSKLRTAPIEGTALQSPATAPGIARSVRENLPRIRLLPDGSIDEISPEALEIRDRDGSTLQVRLTRNRLSYEIANAQSASDIQATAR